MTLYSDVGGDLGLADNTSGLTAFQGNVGGTTALVSVTTDAPGTTDLNGSVVTTTSAQNYSELQAPDHVEWLTSIGRGAITFNSTVDGNFALTVNTSGLTA